MSDSNVTTETTLDAVWLLADAGGFAKDTEHLGHIAFLAWFTGVGEDFDFRIEGAVADFTGFRSAVSNACQRGMILREPETGALVSAQRQSVAAFRSGLIDDLARNPITVLRALTGACCLARACNSEQPWVDLMLYLPPAPPMNVVGGIAAARQLAARHGLWRLAFPSGTDKSSASDDIEGLWVAG